MYPTYHFGVGSLIGSFVCILHPAISGLLYEASGLGLYSQLNLVADLKEGTSEAPHPQRGNSNRHSIESLNKLETLNRQTNLETLYTVS